MSKANKKHSFFSTHCLYSILLISINSRTKMKSTRKIPWLFIFSYIMQCIAHYYTLNNNYGIKRRIIGCTITMIESRQKWENWILHRQWIQIGFAIIMCDYTADGVILWLYLVNARLLYQIIVNSFDVLQKKLCRIAVNFSLE